MCNCHPRKCGSREILNLVTAVIAVTTIFTASGIAYCQSAERGEAVFKAVTKKYPEVQPFVWGLATANPEVALFIPETAWTKLPKADQVSLTLYVESLIPVARANPEKYLDGSPTEPLDDVVRDKVTKLCADCWVMGVGRLTINEKGVLFDKVVVQGDSRWEGTDPGYRGVKASEFRRGLSSVVSAGNGASLVEKGREDTLLPSAKSARAKSAPPQKLWSVQVAATQDKAAANAVVQQLQAEGYEAYTVRVERQGKEWYRVRVGRFASRTEASSTAARLQQEEKSPQAFIVSE